MEKFSPDISNVKFESPEQELAYLREQIARKEKVLAERGEAVNKEQIAREAVVAYGKHEAGKNPPSRLSDFEKRIRRHRPRTFSGASRR